MTRMRMLLPGVLIGLCMGCLQQSAPVETLEVHQATTQRIWKKIELDTLPVTWQFSRYIYDATWLKIFHGDLFVLDIGDITIKRFTPEGELKAVYGKTKGQGPGEIQGISDWHVQPDGQVFISNLNTRKIHQFDADGTYVRTISLKTCMPYRMAGLNPQQLVVWCLTSDPMFLSITPEGEIVKRFGRLLVDPERYYLALEGRMFSRPEGGFVFVPRLASYLYFFDAEGSLEYSVQTLDRLDYPLDRLKHNPRVSARDLAQPIHQYAISFTDDALWLQVGIRRKPDKERTWAWDRYDLKTLQYTYSMVQPVPGFGGWHENHLYIARDTTIQAFRVIMNTPENYLDG